MRPRPARNPLAPQIRSDHHPRLRENLSLRRTNALARSPRLMRAPRPLAHRRECSPMKPPRIAYSCLNHISIPPGKPRCSMLSGSCLSRAPVVWESCKQRRALGCPRPRRSQSPSGATLATVVRRCVAVWGRIAVDPADDEYRADRSPQSTASSKTRTAATAPPSAAGQCATAPTTSTTSAPSGRRAPATSPPS